MSKAWQITDAWTVQNFMSCQVEIENNHLYWFFGSIILFFMLLICQQHFSNNFILH